MSDPFPHTLMRCIALLCILTFVGQAGQAAGDSTRYDVFPLRTNLHIRYSYEHSYHEHDYYHARDSGTVDMIVHDSTIVGDTLCLWSVEQRNRVFHKLTTSGGSFDTLIAQDDTTRFTLTESLIGDHMVVLPENAFFDHLWARSVGPWSGFSVLRYATQPSHDQAVYRGYQNYDSLQFRESLGLISRIQTIEWIGTSWSDDTLRVTQLKTPTVGVPLHASVPTQFRLLQNFPNPFNPTTTISFLLTTENRVQLAVYDLLGRHIVTLIDGRLSAGEHSTDFRPTTLSAGMYFYRLQAGPCQQTRTMTLLP